MLYAISRVANLTVGIAKSARQDARAIGEATKTVMQSATMKIVDGTMGIVPTFTHLLLSAPKDVQRAG